MKHFGKFKKKYQDQMAELKHAKESREQVEADIRAEYEAKLDAERQATREAIATLRREVADNELIAKSRGNEAGEIALLLMEAREAIARQREENNALVAANAELTEKLAAVEPQIAAANARAEAAAKTCTDLQNVLTNHEARLRKKDQQKVDAIMNNAALRGILPTPNFRP